MKRAIGMEMTIYDPRHDHDSRGAALLTDILEDAFRQRGERASRPQSPGVPPGD